MHTWSRRRVYKPCNLGFNRNPQIGEILPPCDFSWLSLPFFQSYVQVEPLDRFSSFMAQTMCFRTRMVLFGVRTMGDYIWGKYPPKTTQKWAWIGNFQPKRQNIKITISPKDQHQKCNEQLMNWLNGHNSTVWTLTETKQKKWCSGEQGMSCATYSFINDSWRNGQFRHYVKSRKETVVYETVEKSRRFTGRSDHFDVPLSVSCATCSRICWHLNLTKEKESKLDLSRSFSRGSSETTRISSGIEL